MPADPKQKARKAARRAQADFESTRARHEKASEVRRESFEQAQAAGLSMRDIAQETGLHYTRIAQILRRK